MDRPWLPVGLPFLYVLLSFPLALRWIEPNLLYGYRTSASLSSVESWYLANELAGWIGVAFSTAAVLINLGLLRWSRLDESRSLIGAWVVTVVATLAFALTAFFVKA